MSNTSITTGVPSASPLSRWLLIALAVVALTIATVTTAFLLAAGTGDRSEPSRPVPEVVAGDADSGRIVLPEPCFAPRRVPTPC